ncbi:hypothetical protein TrVE_jg7085 [Triparma verrucosa]|uniref:High light inducible protein n=1 Tax=Triparma verrucosa TaxID=1606542 RepID=A0A9W7FDI0_9STRA|nr:hypothetical protein TrVE_jg7085 [Triparma verrucosa]
MLSITLAFLVLLLSLPHGSSFAPQLSNNLATNFGRADSRVTPAPSAFSVNSSARSRSRSRAFSTSLNSEDAKESREKFDVADGLVDQSERPPNPLKPLTDLQLAEQRKGLTVLEEKWRREREQEEYDNARLLGWTKQAEMYNGRFAMFFLVVGLLTEKWTGVTMPGQIEELLRIAGIIEM